MTTSNEEPDALRLYSFTANLYLSPIQNGIQTMHARDALEDVNEDSPGNLALIHTWRRYYRTVVVLGAMNHAGVGDAYRNLQFYSLALGGLMLPAIFYEDEQSMNCMATACAIVLPRKYFKASTDAERVRDDEVYYDHRSVEGQFVNFLKSYRLA